MGFVVLNGLYEPGTSVSLFRVKHDALHAGAGELVGRRAVDAQGRLGFDGLNEGDRFIARGTDTYGNPLESRCRTIVKGEGTELAQSPILPVPQNVGTQEAKPVKAPLGEPGAILQSGVPSGVPSDVAPAA
jgi:hypothetical protein